MQLHKSTQELVKDNDGLSQYVRVPTFELRVSSLGLILVVPYVRVGGGGNLWQDPQSYFIPGLEDKTKALKFIAGPHVFPNTEPVIMAAAFSHAPATSYDG